MKNLSLFLLLFFFFSFYSSIQSLKEKIIQKRKLEEKKETDQGNEENQEEPPKEEKKEENDEVEPSDEQNKEIESSCNNELLYSMGVLNSGYRNEKSILCQNAIKASCCSKTSEKIIMNFWNNNNKIKIKQYIEGYIWLFKAILNFYEDYLEKAKKIKNFPDAGEACTKAAESLIGNYQEKNALTEYILTLEKSYQHLSFVRKSFYCALCTIDTQAYFNVPEKTIVYANKFCENLVSSTITEFHIRETIYMRIFNDMNVIADCDPNKTYIPDVYQIDMGLPEEEDVALSKCFTIYEKDQDPRVFLQDCYDYCKKFSITSAKENFEGHFGKLNYLFEKIKSEGKEPEDPVFTDIDITTDWDFSFVNPTFFESNLNGYDLGNYTSVFEKEGIELFYISAKTNLKFQHLGLASIFRHSIYFIGVLFFCLFYQFNQYNEIKKNEQKSLKQNQII